jgi:hypothetical protein
MKPAGPCRRAGMSEADSICKEGQLGCGEVAALTHKQATLLVSKTVSAC